MQLQQENQDDCVPFLDLPMARHRFTLDFHGKGKLPDYPSLGFRGLLGRSLQKLVCPLPGPPVNKCKACLINGDCSYYCVYEQQSNIPGRADATKGYIVYVAPFSKGRQLTMELTLFGRCADFFPALYVALQKSGETGLGCEARPKNTFQVGEAIWLTPDGPQALESKQTTDEPFGGFPLAQWLRQRGQSGTIARLITPLSLTKQRENNLDWSLFYGNLARRLEGLNMIHGSGEGLGKERWLEMKKDFSTWPVPVTKLRLTLLERYSGRQGQKHPMDGFTGEVDLQGFSARQRVWWQVASLIHVGRHAAMGMGRVVVG